MLAASDVAMFNYEALGSETLALFLKNICTKSGYTWGVFLCSTSRLNDKKLKDPSIYTSDVETGIFHCSAIVLYCMSATLCYEKMIYQYRGSPSKFDRVCDGWPSIPGLAPMKLVLHRLLG